MEIEQTQVHGGLQLKPLWQLLLLSRLSCFSTENHGLMEVSLNKTTNVININFIKLMKSLFSLRLLKKCYLLRENNIDTWAYAYM